MFGAGSIFGAVGGGLGGGFPPRQVFEEQYHCYSVAYADKAHLEVRALERRLTIRVARKLGVDVDDIAVCLSFLGNTIASKSSKFIDYITHIYSFFSCRSVCLVSVVSCPSLCM